MDCIVSGIAKSRTQLSNFHFHFLDVKQRYSAHVRTHRQPQMEDIIHQGCPLPHFCPTEIGAGPHLFEFSGVK